MLLIVTETRPSGAPRYLVVVRSDRPDVYERLRAIGAPGVDLLWDRRRAERRATRTSVTMERRARDRRHPPPTTWAVLGFVVVHRGRAPA
jgi:hypothetical protein